MHLLVDHQLPADLNKPLLTNIPRQVIHLGDGTKCRTLELVPGWNTIRSLVANGGHMPGELPITSVIDIKVRRVWSMLCRFAFRRTSRV